MHQGVRSETDQGAHSGLKELDDHLGYLWGDHSLLQIIYPALKFKYLFVSLFIYWSIVDNITLVSGVQKLIFNFSF